MLDWLLLVRGAVGGAEAPAEFVDAAVGVAAVAAAVLVELLVEVLRGAAPGESAASLFLSLPGLLLSVAAVLPPLAAGVAGTELCLLSPTGSVEVLLPSPALATASLNAAANYIGSDVRMMEQRQITFEVIGAQ